MFDRWMRQPFKMAATAAAHRLLRRLPHPVSQLLTRSPATSSALGDDATRPGSESDSTSRAGALTDVSLPMLRNGWVCRHVQARPGMTASRVGPRSPGAWSLERQEQLMTVAGLRPLRAPWSTISRADFPAQRRVPCSVGGAQTDSLFGLSEGVRLSWLPCTFCNAAPVQAHRGHRPRRG